MQDKSTNAQVISSNSPEYGYFLFEIMINVTFNIDRSISAEEEFKVGTAVQGLQMTWSN